MKNFKCLLAVIVAGIVGNALDYFVQGKLLTEAYYSKMDSMRHDTAPGWFILGDFIAVFVFAWVFKKVASAFKDGASGGACAGFTLGVLVNFPTWHFIQLTVKGYPYALTWINTLYGIAWYVVIGAIVGAMSEKPAPAAAPAA